MSGELEREVERFFDDGVEDLIADALRGFGKRGMTRAQACAEIAFRANRLFRSNPTNTAPKEPK